MKKNIPNIVTSLNLFSGCLASLMALKGDYLSALYFIIASGVFDFFDGFVARLLKVSSPFGKELDSLADVISFGFVPSVVVYRMMIDQGEGGFLPFIAFLIVVFSAWRLAKFNIDSRQETDFIGLNTPMNTFFIISLPFIQRDYPRIFEENYLLVALVLLVSYMLISEIRLFSMKFKTLAWSDNKYKFIFILVSFLLVFMLHMIAVPFILLLYFVFSAIHFRTQSV